MRSKSIPFLSPYDQLRSRLGDYLTLCKPRLLGMVVLSAMMGYYLPGVTSDPTKIFHLILGTLLIGGGAHVLNQWFEREQDARMRRTCQRPIPTGRVSEEEAILLGATLSIVGFSYLLAFTGWLTALLGAATHLTYLLLYTPLKQKNSCQHLGWCHNRGPASIDGLECSNRCFRVGSTPNLCGTLSVADATFFCHRLDVSGRIP